MLNLRASRAGRCVGSIGYDGDSAELIRIGDDVWIRAGAQFWMSHANVSREFAADVAGKWAHNNAIDVTQACDMRKLMASMYGDESTAGQSPDPMLTPGIVDGQQVLTLMGRVDGQTLVLTLLAEAPHYVLETRSNAGAMAFSHINEPVEATPPPADEVIELGRSAAGSA